MSAIRSIPGAKNIFDDNGELNLTVEDIKMGKKLDQLERLKIQTKGEEMQEAKLAYYRNLKPRGGIFKVQEMDPGQEIIQRAHDKTQKHLAKKNQKKLVKKGDQDFSSDEDSPIELDPDVKIYREVREKFKKKKIKTNLDLMEAFNETALKFIPLYQKRVNQQEMIARYSLNNTLTNENTSMSMKGIQASKVNSIENLPDGILNVVKLQNNSSQIN